MAMVSDDEIERIGMQIAMKHEKKHGRIPVDLSAENHGFDIRSMDYHHNARYIEVKAHSEIGAMALTQISGLNQKDFRMIIIFMLS